MISAPPYSSAMISLIFFLFSASPVMIATLPLTDLSLLLDRFDHINRKNRLSVAFVSDDQQVACIGCTSSVRTVAVLLQNIHKLFAHAAHRNKVGEQLLLLLLSALLFLRPVRTGHSGCVPKILYRKSIMHLQSHPSEAVQSFLSRSASQSLLLSGVVELRISDSTGSSSGISRSSGSSLSVGLNSSCSPAAIDS